MCVKQLFKRPRVARIAFDYVRSKGGEEYIEYSRVKFERRYLYLICTLGMRWRFSNECYVAGLIPEYKE